MLGTRPLFKTVFIVLSIKSVKTIYFPISNRCAMNKSVKLQKKLYQSIEQYHYTTLQSAVTKNKETI